MPNFLSPRSITHYVSYVFFLVVAQPVFALDPDQSLSQHSMRIWRTDQGLPHDAVMCLAQTPDGYLWCGTEHGLARFDGKVFTIFNRTNTPAITNNAIHALMTDHNGVLWIGTGGGGLVRLEGKTFTNLKIGDGLVGDVVNCLAEDPTGAIWIGTNSGLSKYLDGQFTNYTEADGLPGKFCRSLCVDSTGRLWIGTGQKLSCLSGGQFLPIACIEKLPKGIVQSIRATRDGTLWIGVGAKLNRLRDGHLETFSGANGLTGGTLNSLLEDRDGNFWVGTYAGLCRWRGEQVTGRFASPSIMDWITFSMLEDKTGNLWVGTADGLVCMANGRCVSTSKADGLAADRVKCVIEDRHQQLWAGTLDGLSVRRDGKWTSFKTLTDSDLKLGKVITICEDSSSDMWIGTALGLIKVHDGRLELIKAPDEFNRSGNIHSLYWDRKKTLWISTTAGDIWTYRSGLFIRVPELQVLKGSYGRVFFEDKFGALWIITNGEGIYVLKGDQVERHTTKNGLSSDTLLSIYQDTDGAIWVGTHGGGLCRFSENQWTHFDSSNGLPDNIFYHVIENGPFLWLSSTKGIIRVRKNELTDSNCQIRALVLGKNDGMPILDCNGGTQPAGWRTKDGLLWFPTDRGLVTVNPTKVQSNAISPKVLLEQVLSDGTIHDAEGPITVPPGRGVLEFRYTATDLSDAESLRFRYKLEGFDSDWVEANGRRTAYYTNLSPKKYTFHVIASYGDGVWQETPTSIELVLRPHFYQTFWFYALCAIAITATVFSWHVYRVRLHRKQKVELARCVAERTSELKKEVEHHARTGELLRQSQKLEAVGQLAGGIAHDFNNLLTVINGYAELILEAHQDEPQERDMLQEMLTAGHRAADLTHQLLAFSRRQVLSPKILDPNVVVDEVQRMIVRLIGENITLTTELDRNVYRVKVDPVQLQQVLINLCVNARDAMPQCGSIKISTRNVVLEQKSRIELPDAEPGAYVVLEVADTGCGMSETVRLRIFEPFFTTKGLGEGTGLGLATVYGIVRQSGGYVAVQSAVGVGTSFQIYLPYAAGEMDPDAPLPAIGSAPRGEETVLLVEDEKSVLAIARHLLLSCGYHVLEAENGRAALQLARNYDGRIDVLVSDVVMPKVSGRELAEEMRKDRPYLRVLFVSGYTDDVILRYGITEADVKFLQKPYSPAMLAAKVREVLDHAPTEDNHPELVVEHSH